MDQRKLSKAINEKLIEVTDVFGDYQKKTGLHCPEGCGRCCLKSEISCAPHELLPMAFHLIDSGRAEAILEKAHSHTDDKCLFLVVSDEVMGKGSCGEYDYRPFICRAFGISSRQGKYDKIERSICKTLSEIEASSAHLNLIDDEIPQIDVWKKKLESIDPQLLNLEIPIYKGIIMILEKLLLWKDLSEQG